MRNIITRLWITLSLVILLTSACSGTNSSTYTHYSDSELGFSFYYPSNWQLDELNPGELVVKSRASQIEQMQIWVFPKKLIYKAMQEELKTENVFSTLPEEAKAEIIRANSLKIVESMNGTDFTVIRSGTSNSKWDWVITYSFNRRGNSIIGEGYYKETANVTYYIEIFRGKDSPYTEGYAVVESFKFSY